MSRHMLSRAPRWCLNGITEIDYPSLLIVSSCGQSPLENRVIGSTTRNLARTTGVPLLVNRAERAVDGPDIRQQRATNPATTDTDDATE